MPRQPSAFIRDKVSATMLELFQKAPVWWVISGIFTVIFVIASVPRPSLEALPWLVFAAAAAGAALAPDGAFKAAWAVFVRVGWDNTGMRWHLVAALLLSVALTFLTMGMTGFFPVALTGVVLHPTDAVTFLRKLNATPLGDEGWPFMILSGLLWPWSLPAAYALTTQTSVFALAVGWRSVIYGGIVCAWWVSQSIALSFLTFGRNIFLR